MAQHLNERRLHTPRHGLRADGLCAALARGDAGGGSVLGGLLGSGLMGLAGKLNAAGLDMTQIRQLGQEILAHAETVVGKERVREIADRIPGLSQFL